MKKILALVLALLMVFSFAACGKEEVAETTFPEKEIKIIVPWNAGGGNDVAARELQPLFKSMYDVDVVIENVAGGSSAVGLTQAITSPADGYTIGFMTSTYLGLAAQGTVSNDFDNEFEPICMVMQDPNAIVCKKGTYETLDDFIADAKANPGLVMATSASFGTGPIYSKVLSDSEGLNAQVISYDSGSRCVTEVLGGHVAVSVSNYTDFVDQIAAGELVCLALCTEERSPLLPDVPTVAECGYDIFTLGYIQQMSFMVAPKGIDAAVKAKLCEMFNGVCLSDEYQAFASSRSYISSGMTGDDLQAAITNTYNGMKSAYETYFAE